MTSNDKLILQRHLKQAQPEKHNKSDNSMTISKYYKARPKVEALKK